MATKAELEAQREALKEEYRTTVSDLKERYQQVQSRFETATATYEKSRQTAEDVRTYQQEQDIARSRFIQLKSDLADFKTKFEARYKALNRQIDEASDDNTSSADTQSTASTGSSTDSNSGSSSSLTDLTKGVAGQVTAGVGKISDLASGVSNKVKSATDAITSIGGVLSKVGDAVKSAKDAISDSISSAANFASSLFSGNDKDAKAPTKTPNPNQGPKDPQIQITTLSPNSAEAIKEPITFKTGDLKSGRIAGTTKSDPNKDEDFPLLGKLAKSAKEFSEKTGKTIRSFTDAVKEFTTDLKNKYTQGVNTLKSVVKSVTEPIRSTISAVNNVVGAGLAQVRALVNPIVGAVNDVTVGLKGAVGDLASILPGNLGTQLKHAGENAIDSLITNKVNNALSNVTGVINALNGVASSNDILSIASVIAKKPQGDYGTIADENGLSLQSKYGSNSSSNIDHIYAFAKTICAGVNKDTTYNYSYNKDAYDILMGLCAKTGIPDLITQMKNCNGGANSYFDDRTKQMLSELISDPVAKGDANTYYAVQSTVGARNVTHQVDKLRTLGANLSGDDGKIAPENKEAYNKAVQAAKCTMRNLVSKNTNVSLAQNVRSGGKTGEEEEEEEVLYDGLLPAATTETQVTTTEVIDAAYIAMLVAGGSIELAEDVMSRDNVIATCMAYKLYGGYA